MRTLVSRFRFGWIAALLALLAGCGGGETTRIAAQVAPPPPPPPPVCDPPPEGTMTSLPKGVFGGTIEGHPDGSFILVSTVRPYYPGVFALMLRGPDLVSPSPGVKSITRFSAGDLCSDVDKRVSNGSAGPFGATDYDALYVNATLDPGAPKVSGTLRYLGGTQATYRLSGGPITGTNYEPTASPALADIAGDWSLINADGHAVQLSVASDGKISGSVQGCTLTGTLQADADGLNLYSARLRPAAACPAYATRIIDFSEAAISGFALAMPLSGGGTQLLLWAEADTGWGPMDFVLAIGRR